MPEELKQVGGEPETVSDIGAPDDGATDNAAAAAGEGSGGSEFVTGQATRTIAPPPAGQTDVIRLEPGERFELAANPAMVRLAVDGDNLVMGFDLDGDGEPDSFVVLEDLILVAGGGNPPVLVVAGETIGVDLLVSNALALAQTDEFGAAALETAVGPALGGGNNIYSDNLGTPIDLLNAQGVIPPTELQFGLVELEDEIVLLDEEEETENQPPAADPVLTSASPPGEEGELPPDLVTALNDAGESPSSIAFFRQLDVDGSIGDDDDIIADFGGADTETSLENIVFTLQSAPAFGQLILVTAGGDTSSLTPGATFSSEDTVWWIATETQIADFLAQPGAPEFLPEVDFLYSVTDEAGASDTAPVVITLPPPEPPGTGIGVAQGLESCLTEDTLGALKFFATPTDDVSKISQIVISGFPTGDPADAWVVDASSVSIFGFTSPADFTASYDSATGELTITFTTASFSLGEAVDGTVDVTPNPDSDVDVTLTIEATAINGAGSETGSSSNDTRVDAVADEPTVEVLVNAGDDDGFSANEDGTLTVNAQFFDLDTSETFEVVVNVDPDFTVDAASIHPTGSLVGNTITYTLTVADLVGSGNFTDDVTITAPAVVQGDSYSFDATATATEVATVTGSPDGDGSNGEHGYECDDENNAAQDGDDDTVGGVDDLAAATVGGSDCTNEDDDAEQHTNGEAETDHSVFVQLADVFNASDDEEIEGATLSFSGVVKLGGVALTSGVALTTGQLSDWLDGTSDIEVVVPGDSDADITIGFSLDIVDPGSGDTDTVSGDYVVYVDAVADKPTVSVAADAGGDGTFSSGETGSVTVSAQFFDLDGSEVFEVTVEIPAGFTVDESTIASTGSLDLVTNTITYTLTKDDLDGSGNFTGTVVITAPAGLDGSETFTFDATATATESLVDGGCDEGDEDDASNNFATAEGSDTVAGDAQPEINTADNVLLDEDDLEPHGTDQTPEPAGDRVNEGDIEIDYFADQPGDLSAAFSFTGGNPAVGPNGETVTYHPAGDGQSMILRVDDVDTILVEIAGTTDNGGGNITYHYQATLLSAIDHLVGDNGENTFVFTPEFEVTDEDGDTANGDFGVTVIDDVPNDISPDAALIGSGDGSTFTGDLDFFDNVGADKNGDVTFDSSLDGEQLLSGGIPVTTNGFNIYLQVSADGRTLTAFADVDGTGDISAGDTEVFTVVLNPDAVNECDDEYLITLHDNIDTGAEVVFDDFSAAPAGQNEWLGLDADGGDIDADNNDSMDLLITPTNVGGTVNTDVDDMGSGNQWIDTGEGLRVDFVIDVERLGALDEKDADGWTHEGHYSVNRFSFRIHEVQGSGNTAAVLVSAFLDPDGNLTVGDGVPVTLSPDEVIVRDENGIDVTASVTIWQFNDSLIVEGLEEGWQVQVISDTSFNSIEIDNADSIDGASGDSFSLSEYTLSTEATGDPVDLSFDLDVVDEDGDTAEGTLEVTVLPQVEGTTGDDTLTAGTNGSDLVGGDGDDVLIGSDADDKLQGGDGVDTISDGAGNDLIIGGDGADVINLAADDATDVLVYNALSERGDTINGFVGGLGGDLIDLSDLLDGDPDLPDCGFTGTTLDEAEDGGYVELRPDGAGNAEVWVDVDGSSGGGAAELIATLNGIDIADLADNIVVD